MAVHGNTWQYMAIHGNRKNKQTVLKSSTKGRFGDLHCLFWWRVCNTITSNPKLTGDIRWPLNVQFCTCTAQRHKGSQTCHSSDYSDLPMTDPCMVGIYANMTGGILMGSMAHHIYIAYMDPSWVNLCRGIRQYPATRGRMEQVVASSLPLRKWAKVGRTDVITSRWEKQPGKKQQLWIPSGELT